MLEKEKSHHNYMEERHLNLAMRKYFFFLLYCQIHRAKHVQKARKLTYVLEEITIDVELSGTVKR